MPWKIKNKGFSPYLNILESELQFIASIASRMSGKETGGELYGFFTHAGRPMIMLATPPGPNAIHQVAHFRQCIDFFKQVNSFFRDKYGLQYIGNFHSHHKLGIKGLSSGDIHSTHLIASKNGYRRFCQIVVTFDSASHANRQNHRHYDEELIERTSESIAEKKGLAYTDTEAYFAAIPKTGRIRIRSFIYQDAASGDPVHCPLNIIPGKSPFRQALEKNTPIPELGKRYKLRGFSIIYDSLKPRPEIKDTEPDLPPRICDQIDGLPEAVTQDIRVKFVDGLIFLSLPIPSKEGLLTVIYNDTPPHRIEAVYLTPNVGSDTPLDLTNEALSRGPYTRLDNIFEKIQAIGVENNLCEEGHSCMDVDDENESSSNQTKTPAEVYKKEDDWFSEPFCGEGI